MRRLSLVCVISSLVVGLTAAGPQAIQIDTLFASAQYKETTEGDLRAAIDLYARVVGGAGSRRPLAAAALIRMAACHEKLGQADEAAALYVRVQQEYTDQRDQATLAHARLTDMGVGVAAPAQAAPDALRTELVWDRALSPYGTVSPDGRRMTYVDWGNGGNLAIHDFVSGETRQLTDTANNGSRFANVSRIAPDGRSVIYEWAAGSEGIQLRLLSLEGNPAEPRTVWSPANRDVEVAILDWFPDGTRVVASLDEGPGNPRRIVTVTLEGQVQPLRSGRWGSGGGGRYFSPGVAVSPDGRHVAYSAPASEDRSAQDIFIMAVDGSSEAAIVQNPADDVLVAWSPSGRYLLFESDRSGRTGLWAQRIENARAVGAPRLLMPNLDVATFNGITRDGTLHYAVSVQRRRLKAAELDLTNGKLLQQPVELLERFLGSNTSPVLWPDGRTLGYTSNRPDGTSAIVLRSLETGEERDIIPVDLTDITGLRRSADGVISVSGRETPDGRRGSFVVDTATGATRRMEGGRGRQVPRGSFLSPDRQSIATIVARPDGWRHEIRLSGVAGGDGRVLASAGDDEGFGRWIVWTPDSRALLVLVSDRRSPDDSPRLRIIPVDGSASVATELAYRPTAGGAPSLIVHPDGKRLFYMDGNAVYQSWALHNLGLDRPAGDR